MNVGQRIKSARQALGLSQSDLADLTDVSQPTVANWEKGSHAPRHATLSKIAGALKSTPASLLETGAAGGTLPGGYARACLAISTASRASLVTTAKSPDAMASAGVSQEPPHARTAGLAK